MIKLHEAVKINEAPLMGNKGKKLIADWLELSEQMRNLFVGQEQSRTPDAFGQGATGGKRGEFKEALALLDKLTDQVEKDTGVQSAVPKDIQY